MAIKRLVWPAEGFMDESMRLRNGIVLGQELNR